MSEYLGYLWHKRSTILVTVSEFTLTQNMESWTPILVDDVVSNFSKKYSKIALLDSNFLKAPYSSKIDIFYPRKV